MIKYLKNIGSYFLLLSNVFKWQGSRKIFWKLIMREVNDLSVSSFGLVLFISLFMGAVTAIQMFNNFQGAAIPIPDYYIGFSTKTVLILEFAPTMISIILAGKIGSYIASSIGAMRSTEQIDAYEVMGINTPSFLILPKIIALMVFNPILVMISITVGILGGYLAGIITGSWSAVDFITGIQMGNDNYFYLYCFTKTIVFAFVIATVPAFYGYYVKGGSLEVGRASTSAVVWTSVTIIVLELVITQMMLS